MINLFSINFIKLQYFLQVFSKFAECLNVFSLFFFVIIPEYLLIIATLGLICWKIFHVTPIGNVFRHHMSYFLTSSYWSSFHVSTVEEGYSIEFTSSSETVLRYPKWWNNSIHELMALSSVTLTNLPILGSCCCSLWIEHLSSRILALFRCIFSNKSLKNQLN